MVSVAYSFECFEQSFKNIKNILSSQAVQKQALDQIIPMGCSLPNPVPEQRFSNFYTVEFLAESLKGFVYIGDIY